MAFVSCVGLSGPVAFRSRGCNLALAGMAPVCGVTIAMQAVAGMGAVPGVPLTLVGVGSLGGFQAPAGRGSDLLSKRRTAIFVCRATGLEGDDYHRFDHDELALKLCVPELLDVFAKQTMVVLDRVHLPKPEGFVLDKERPSVSSEIAAIRAGCKELVDELGDKETPISVHPAAVKLVGLHARIFNLFTFCRVQKEWPVYIVPSSLEMITKETLRRTMSNTLEFYTELQKQPNKDISGPIQEGEVTLSKLLAILIKKTTLLLKEIPSILVPVNHATTLPLRNLMPSATLGELEELQVMCDMLREKVGPPDILDDQVAFGTLQGIDGLLRDILFVVTQFFYGGQVHDPLLLDDKLKSIYKSSLVRSMSQVQDCLREYTKKETE